MNDSRRIDRLKELISAKRNSLLGHGIYKKIHSVQHLQLFMQSHVFAVWMSELCGNSDEKWQAATEAADSALAARIRLWDAIDQQIVGEQPL